MHVYDENIPYRMDSMIFSFSTVYNQYLGNEGDENYEGRRWYGATGKRSVPADTADGDDCAAR